MTYADQALIDAALRTDFPAFVRHSFLWLNSGATFLPNWHIEALAYQLGRVWKGEITRLIINLPPRSLKSHIGSVAFPAGCLGNNPTLKIISVSYSQELSAKLASDFRRVIESSWYKRVFGLRPLFKNSESEVQTDEGGSRLATSIGGTLTGRGGNIIIIDDPLNAIDAYSKPARERVNAWFANTLYSRLDDKQTGAIIVIMQRLHPDDLAGHLLQQGGWQHLRLPAIAPQDQHIPIDEGKSHFWPKGEVLHPARDPLESLELIKKLLGSDAFNAQFLQDPLPETGNMLRRQWLQTYDDLPLRQPSDRIVQSWDTAQKAGEMNDYSACLTFLERDRNHFYLIDVYRDRLELPELVKRVISHAQKFQANGVLIEEKVSGIPLIQTVRRAGLQGVIAVKPTGDKVTRMYGQTAKLESGCLFLPKSAPWLADFLAEYLAFPKGRHDDQIDALSQFLIRQPNQEISLYFDFGQADDTRHLLGAPDPREVLSWRGIR